MKAFLLILFASFLASFGMTSCRTAHDVAEDSVDLAGHAVEKTGHAVAHGARKVENNL
jgi:predicted small secreted protein